MARFFLVSSMLFLFCTHIHAQQPDTFPGTTPLTMKGDIASTLVEQVDQFLLKELEKSVADRSASWPANYESPQKYVDSLAGLRQRLATILGVVEERVPFDGVSLIGTTKQSPLVSETPVYRVFAVKWPVIGDIEAEGLLLVPRGEVVADIVVVPDADLTPEQMVGLSEGVAADSQFARRLVESGCRVLIPTLIDRTVESRNRRVKLSTREFLYRSAFEMGRHIIGYEVQAILAGVDWFSKDRAQPVPIGVAGWGEGGLQALYSAALDPRIDSTLISGHFGPREGIWQEPIDRNVHGLLEHFGDAELVAMIAPRAVVIEASQGPDVVIAPNNGGGPGRLTTPALDAVKKELSRAHALTKKVAGTSIELIVSGQGTGAFGSSAALSSFLRSLDESSKLATSGSAPKDRRTNFDAQSRHARLVHKINDHTQDLLARSQYTRDDFMAKLDTSSVKKYEESVEQYREYFYDRVVGRFQHELEDPNPRSRKVYDEPKWTGYEVTLDVFPGVFAYGVLLVPKGIKDGDRRPVVVCQHGLEGRPVDVIEGDHRAYHDFAAKLAEEGFVCFAPQNLYIFKDRFRTLQRKSNPLGKTLFSTIVPQHQQIVDWLQSLPFVDPDRVAFYGLSYGGKTAMRVPPLVTDYALSICSADFNEWVWKNASSEPRNRYTYVYTGEYEIFEFDLGGTFNYAEMASLIAPRPFMVERGHFDGVGPDDRVAYEFARVRHLYQAKLGIGDRCELEWFVGPHTINGKGTFEFLRKHLNWNSKP